MCSKCVLFLSINYQLRIIIQHVYVFQIIQSGCVTAGVSPSLQPQDWLAAPQRRAAHGTILGPSMFPGSVPGGSSVGHIPSYTGLLWVTIG